MPLGDEGGNPLGGGVHRADRDAGRPAAVVDREPAGTALANGRPIALRFAMPKSKALSSSTGHVEVHRPQATQRSET